MRIIGLSGKRGSGKTTLASYFFRHHGFVRVGFSEKIKELAIQLFPELTLEDISDIKKKELKFKNYDWSPRELLVHLGEFMRFHDEDYWLKQGIAKCSNMESSYIFDDVRFKNEARAIKENGGKIVRINRYDKLNPYGTALDIHSENDLDDWEFDAIIEDCENTSLSRLYQAGDRILKFLF